MIFADVIISDQSVYAALIFAGLIYLVKSDVIPVKIEIGKWLSADFHKTRMVSKRLKTPRKRPMNKIKRR